MWNCDETQSVPIYRMLGSRFTDENRLRDWFDIIEKAFVMASAVIDMSIGSSGPACSIPSTSWTG